MSESEQALAALDGEHLIQRLEHLAQFTEDPPRLTRTFLTEQHKAAGLTLQTWMQRAGMQADFDAVGNMVGRYEGREPGLPALLIGSHFDTVRNGGKYDGQLGIVTGIACVEALNAAAQRLPFAIEVIGFADEEGVRFGATLLGSRAVAGSFDMALLDSCDLDGVSMADAIRAYGGDPAGIGALARRHEQLRGYIEVHIEQGPVLLAEELPVGVVTAIAGASRFEVLVDGLAGHAGTVPMALRRDAAAAAAEAVLAVERICSSGDDLVGTVGQLSVIDGAANVIPGRAAFSLDIRSGDDAVRRAAVDAVLEALAAIGERRQVSFTPRATHDAAAAVCDDALTAKLEAAIVRQGLPARRLLSGAGHDAMVFPQLTPITMLFVRCGNGGISHHPDETMTAQDAETGARVLLDFVRSL